MRSLSAALWQRRYGADAGVIGRSITVSDQPVEVVGVAPAGFKFESDVDVWLLGDGGVPRFSSIPNLAQNRDVHFIRWSAACGRASPSRPPRQSSTASRHGSRASIPAQTPEWGIALDPLKSALVGDTRTMLLLLFAAVALMLLIASVNVANLTMVRTQARASELAMRSALGASPRRIIRQILAESLLLAACGGVLGIAMAAWGVQVLVQLAPEGLPRVDEIAVDGRLAAFATFVTAIVGVAFGLWPAWRASRAPLIATMNANARSHSWDEIGDVPSCCWYRVSWPLRRYCSSRPVSSSRVLDDWSR